MAKGRPKPPAEDPLGPLRVRIDEIDNQILALLQERGEVVRQISATKLEHGLPVFVPAREGRKVDAFREKALERGLDPEWAEDFLRMMMSASRESQSALSFPRATPEARTVLLVGGEGSMGTLFRRVLEASGHQVRTLDRDDWPRLDELARGVDLALVAVPIEVTLEVVRRLAPALPAEAVLADITSTKRPVLDAMLEAHPGPVVGLHPMHGPDVKSFSKQLLVVCHGRGKDAYAWVPEQARLWGMRVKAVDAFQHDEAMDLIQGLRHYLALLHGAFLRSWGLDPGQILDFSSPIYRAELMVIGRIFAQKAELYADIVLASPERRQLLVAFFDHHRRLTEMVEQGDREGFIREFEAIGDYFGDFAEQALTESSYLIHRLTDRFS